MAQSLITNTVIPVVISIFLFILYTLTTLMDTNTAIKEFIIGGEAVSSFKFLYSYLAGFFTYFLKITASLFTIYLLLTVIRIAIIVIFNVFQPINTLDNAVRFKADLFEKIKHALSNNGLWVFGLYTLDRFLVFFLAYAPLLFMLVLIFYAMRIYKPDRIKAMDDEELATRSINTFHSQTMFFLMLCILIMLCYYMYVFYSSL